MIPRYILGYRSSGEFGVFISPPGVNADTAPLSQLTLSLSTTAAQIYMQGVCAAPFPRSVIHGLPFAPVVLPNLISTKLVGGTFGYVRPFDNSYGPWTRSRVKSEINQFTVEQEYIPWNNQNAPAFDVNYFVYNKPIPTPP